MNDSMASPSSINKNLHSTMLTCPFSRNIMLNWQDADEDDILTKHLFECDYCQQKVEEARELVAQVNELIPPMVTPPDRDQIEEKIKFLMTSSKFKSSIWDQIEEIRFSMVQIAKDLFYSLFSIKMAVVLVGIAMLLLIRQILI